jgi:hypothetical protein
MRQVEKRMVRYGCERVDGKWRVRCGECGKFHFLGFPPNMDPEALATKFRRAGWGIEWGKPPLCGNCSYAAGQEERPMKDITPGNFDSKGNLIARPELRTPPSGAASSSAMIVAAPVPNEALWFAMAGLLIRNFDKEAHSYNKGWSDERVARETSAPVDAVIALRERNYGPLAEPAELTEIRDRLDDLEARMMRTEAKYESEAAENRRLFDEEMHGYRSSLADLRGRLEKAAHPYQRMATR